MIPTGAENQAKPIRSPDRARKKAPSEASLLLTSTRCPEHLELEGPIEHVTFLCGFRRMAFPPGSTLPTDAAGGRPIPRARNSFPASTPPGCPEINTLRNEFQNPSPASQRKKALLSNDCAECERSRVGLILEFEMVA